MVTKTTTLRLQFPQRIYTYPPEQTQFFPFSLTIDRTRNGSANPKWKEQVKRKISATTSMSGTDKRLAAYVDADMTRITPFGAQAIAPQTGLVDLTRRISGAFPAPTWDGLIKMSASKADSVARARLFGALRQQQAHMQGLVVAGELPQTIREMGKLTKEIASLFASQRLKMQKYASKWLGTWRVDGYGNPYLDPFLNRNWKPPKGRKGVEQTLADWWLTFSFGVRPLVKDVHDLAETVARWRIEKEFGRHTAPGKIRGYGLEVGGITDEGVIKETASTVSWYSTTRHFRQVEVIYRAGIIPGYITPATGSAYRLWQLLGSYDLENWIPTVWNLLPWSFLVDYFTNVADVCTAMVTDTSSVAWVNKTTRWEAHRTYNGRVVPQESGFDFIGRPVVVTQGGNPTNYHTITREVLREADTMAYPPKLTFELPTGGFQVANMIALVAGHTPRTFR